MLGFMCYAWSMSNIHGYNLDEFAGKRFGRWTGLRPGMTRKRPCGRSRHFMWCRCDCGTEQEVQLDNLLAGKTTQCRDCQHEEHSDRITTHGGTGTKEWFAWRNMKNRCYVESTRGYERYGRKGIRVCDRWLESFENFLADMGPAPSPQHSLDRRYSRGNYTPRNCRWTTNHVQNRNKRNNIMITINGVTKCMTDWCREYGHDQPKVSKRLKRGWDPVKAITTP